jgi:hypothetical protein
MRNETGVEPPHSKWGQVMTTTAKGYGITSDYPFIKIITLTLARPAPSIRAFETEGHDYVHAKTGNFRYDTA